MSLMTRRTTRQLAPRAAATATAAVLVGSLTVAPASAGTVVGATFVPSQFCSAPYTMLQFQTEYSTKTAGVISSWQFLAGPTPPQLKFKVFRFVDQSSFTVIGTSGAVTPVANTLNSFPVRVPVRTGDLIGLATLTGGECGQTGDNMYVPGDQPVGSTQAYMLSGPMLDVAALVEPDADGDGYGDETQDACPTQAATHGACVTATPDTTAPDTVITAGPTRTKKRKATFTFTSDDPSATYECRLTGRKVAQIQIKTYHPCTSPQRFKRLRPGRYTLAVRATDAAGNLEAAPATTKLRVVRRST